MTQHDDDQTAGPPTPGILVTIDDAHAALERLGDGTTAADLLRAIVLAGRDARVLIDDPRPPMRQYATLAEFEAAIAAAPRLAAAQALLNRWRPIRVRVTIPGHPIAEFFDALAAAVGDPTGEVLPAIEDDPVAKALGIVRCCDGHGVTCEPPSELCCRHCTERNHPDHPNVDCVLKSGGQR